jgi:hypothetical protein
MTYDIKSFNYLQSSGVAYTHMLTQILCLNEQF